MTMGAPDDVVVVGGGVIGLVVAWRLARDGLSVRLVDAGDPGSASRAAAGMLAPVSEAAYGEEELLALNRAALARFPEVVAEIEADSGLPVGLRGGGTLLIARDGDDWAALSRLSQFRDSLGLPSQRLSSAQRRRCEPFLSAEVRGAVLVPEELSVDNRCYLRSLRAAAARHHVEVVNAVAHGLTWACGRVVGVRTAEGDLPAGTVVLAAGSRTGDLDGLPPCLVLPVRPVKGQVLRLAPAPTGRLEGPLLRHTVRALVHGSHVYLVPRDNGEIVVGATSEEQGHDTTVTVGAVHDLLRDACEVLPGLAELQLRECSAGSRPGTPDNGPLVGPAGVPGLVVATGHHRNGVLLSALTADAVRAAVRAEPLAPEWHGFDPQRFSREVADE